MPPILPRFAFAVGSLVGCGALASCGARTGLLVPTSIAVDDGGGSGSGDAESVADATDDSPIVSPDAPVPLIDASPGIMPNNCPDAGSTLIYIVTSGNGLYSFYPPSSQFHRIGRLSCSTPTPAWAPFSMAVDRQGRAYVLFTDGNPTTPLGQLFRVSTANASCASIPAYAAGQDGFETFGMGFVGNADGVTERLFVALNTNGTTAPPQLGVLDVTTFRLGMVKNITPTSIASAELTGTGDGRLFGFYSQGASSAIAQLDPTTGTALANDNLTALPQTLNGNGGWAFAFWGSDFYLFTTDPAGNGGSIATRFNPADRSQTQVAALSELIVGAGVSTCAPQE
jgi:hypothetical protein